MWVWVPPHHPRGPDEECWPYVLHYYRTEQFLSGMRNELSTPSRRTNCAADLLRQNTKVVPIKTCATIATAKTGQHSPMWKITQVAKAKLR